MRIVFVTAGLGFGGAERVVSVLANQMIEENDVKIILTSGNDQVAYKLKEKISIDVIPKNNSTFKRWKNFRKICVEYQADVVLAFMDSIGIMASNFLIGTRIPVIVSERNDPSQKCRKHSLALEFLGLFSKSFTKGYVFQSKGARSFYPKVAQKKSCIILNPLNTENFPNYNIKTAENKVVSVGRLHEQKNQKLLINAFAKSKYCIDYTLHIYGEGKLRDELQSQINKLGLQGKVFLEGNNANVLNELVKAKLFVFTSNYEGLPNALMEAMALGLPCISTDCSPGGAKMLINDGENGMIVPCDDLDSLVSTMDKLYDDKALCEELGEKAKLIREKTKAKAIAKEWLDFIERCRKGKNA
ncbi:MAG: glycosyltransferase family 4 protein [Clostridiales bacterium]|nr:glycosyltransferase family 4 protein [Clostridiales bacterium]